LNPATAHSSAHFVVGVALLVVSLAGWVAIADHAMRRRFRQTVVILAAFVAVHYAILHSTVVQHSSHFWRVLQGEWLLLGLAVINLLIALIFNPWVGQRARDRAPSIVQDALVVVGIGIFAVVLIGNDMLGWSVGALAVVGFALQDQLGNLFAGLAIQVEKPFRVGHWITIASFEGRVVEVTWRATKIKTKSGNLVIIPNSTMAKEAINNYSEPEAPTRLTCDIGASYLVPPNETKDAIMAALRQVPRILPSPAASAVLKEFGEAARMYRAYYWVADFADASPISDQVRRAIYYEFNRRGIEIPWPIQVQYERVEPPVDTPERRESFASTIAAVPVLAPLSSDVHRALAAAAAERLFGAEEEIVYEGEPGASMFIIRRGRVAITIGKDEREVAVIDAGGYFGEMSLLTGEPRSATVTARGDCTVLEISANAFRDYVRDHPEVIEPLAAAAETRRRELDKSRQAVSSTTHEHLSLKQRMRQFFGLS
jgi:small-conductance mechanosensitive channel/CRP-like cAMP-binding protein